MALTFPLEITGLCAWRQPHFSLVHAQELGATAGGPSQGFDLGPALWMVDFKSVPLSIREADAVMAKLRALGGVKETFLTYPVTHAYPISDAEDALDGYTLTVQSISADRTQLRITTLPVGFVLSTGDFISIKAGDSFEFVQVVEDSAPAGAAGVSGWIDVTPPLRAAVATTQTVNLQNPRAEMRLVPRSLKDSWDGLNHRTVEFQALQVVR